MSIASAIATKQQQVADCYTVVSDKGGTLPVNQNLTNLADAIDSISGGGNLIFAENRLGRTPVNDEKVLLTRNTTTANSYSTAGSDSYFGQSFIVDERFYQVRAYSNKLDIIEPNTWNTITTFSFNTQIDPRCVVVRNGTYWWWNKLNGNGFNIVNFDPFEYIKTEATFLPLNDNLKLKASDGKIYSIDESQSYDTGLGAIAVSNKYIVQLFGNTLACLRQGNAYFIDLTNFPNCTSTQVLSGGKSTPIGFSGINEGDYVITTDDSTVCCYKLISGSYVLDKIYSNWYRQNTVYFDCSNGLLCIVDAYKYPHTYIVQNGNIIEKEIPSDIRATIHTNLLNNTTNSREYGDLYFQSNKSLTKFVWGWWTGSCYRRFCQAKADNIWYISESSVQNYQSLGSFTAYITGNTNINGDYEVKTLLPKIDTITCTLNVSDDTIIPILGVEEL